MIVGTWGFISFHTSPGSPLRNIPHVQVQAELGPQAQGQAVYMAPRGYFGGLKAFFWAQKRCDYFAEAGA